MLNEISKIDVNFQDERVDYELDSKYTKTYKDNLIIYQSKIPIHIKGETKELLNSYKDKPAYVSFFKIGDIITKFEEIWYNKGEIYRKEKPAWKIYYPKGSVHIEKYFNNISKFDKMKNSLFEKEYFENGNIKKKHINISFDSSHIQYFDEKGFNYQEDFVWYDGDRVYKKEVKKTFAIDGRLENNVKYFVDEKEVKKLPNRDGCMIC